MRWWPIYYAIPCIHGLHENHAHWYRRMSLRQTVCRRICGIYQQGHVSVLLWLHRPIQRIGDCKGQNERPDSQSHPRVPELKQGSSTHKLYHLPWWCGWLHERIGSCFRNPLTPGCDQRPVQHSWQYSFHYGRGGEQAHFLTFLYLGIQWQTQQPPIRVYRRQVSGWTRR